MADFVIENEELKVTIASHGAELRSVKDVKSDREYMWCGDAEYWGRVSPVLFPVVGSFRDKEYRWQGKTYSMGQHGFARDMEFCVTGQSSDEIWFCLRDNDETWEKYPFAFFLEIGYKLTGRAVQVLWKVTNPAGDTLYFSIGAHPAFAIPKREADKTTAYMRFAGPSSLSVRKLEGGLASDELMHVSLTRDPEGQGYYAPVTEELFRDDALIVEEHQTGRVEILDENLCPFVTVRFDAPLFGLWTPPMKNAPFLCIEPWYGRCDSIHFEETLDKREWGQSLAGGEVFEASYSITFA